MRWLIIILIALSLMAGCTTTPPNDSGFTPSELAVNEKAPGCNQQGGKLGGCFGKWIITNLNVDPAIDCLKISVNNCNGGVLEVKNTCAQPFNVSESSVSPGSSATFEVAKRNGVYVMINAKDNFGGYYPKENEQVGFTARMGSKAIKLSMIKTKQLC